MCPATEVAAPRYHAAGMHDVPAHDDWLAVPEADRLNGFVFTKRRDEARLGRWTAKCALALALGRERDPASLRDLVIRNASDGAPEAFVGSDPAAVDVSMTDRADWAACMVLPSGRASDPGAAAPTGGLGCDLEVVEPRSPRFVEDWFTPRERAVVDHAANPDVAANLIWSAKESALKVLRTGLRRDTRSVEVELEDGIDEGATDWQPLRVVTAEADTFPGWWRRFGSFVLTCAADRMIAVPQPFVDPCPLTSAAPTHAWMAAPVRTGAARAPAPTAPPVSPEPPRRPDPPR